MMMVELRVEKLPEFVRAGDIVGAITNEVQIEGSQIGKIQINKQSREALVQVEAEVAQLVLDVMNKKQISGSEVKVDFKDNQQLQRQNVREYVNKFKDLLYLERQEKMVKYRMEIRRLSGEERQHLGHALLNLCGRIQSLGGGEGYQVRFSYSEGEELPNHLFLVGDLVIVSTGEPLSETNPKGTVLRMDPTSIIVEFKGKPPTFIYENGLRLDLCAHDLPFQQTLKVLKGLYEPEGHSAKLRAILLGESQPEWLEDEVDVESPNLDPGQIEAFHRAIRAKDLLLIQGGAGTGKTTVGVRVLQYYLQKGLKVLAVGATSISRDGLVNKLTLNGLKVLKLTHVKLSNEPEYYAVCHLLKSIQKLIKRRDEINCSVGDIPEGLNYKEILEKYKCSKGYRGIPGYRLKEIAEWMELQTRIDEKYKEIQQHEEKIFARILGEHDLVCVTYEEATQLQEKFDLVVIDDAHQITEPETLPVFLAGKKVILLGDPVQISPQVISPEAKVGGLGQSLFMRFLNELDEQWICNLNTQHRLDRISWRCLSALCPVGKQLMINQEEISLDLSDWRNGPAAQVLEDKASLIFLDTSQMQIEEEKLGNQYINRLEADLIREIIQTGLNLVEMANKMAILTFYSAQVQVVKNNLELNGISLDSIYMVDEFCGDERELTIVSLVHSNPIGYLGKLGSIQHLITALTRAKGKCIIIGNPETLKAHPIYQRLIDEINHWGRIYTL